MTKEIVNAAPPAAEPTTNNVVDTSSTNNSKPIDTNINPNPVPVEVGNKTTPTAEQDIVKKESLPTKDKTKGVLSSIEEEQKEQEAYWKDDWKQKVAGDNEKLSKIVDKFKSPKELAEAYQALQKDYSKTRPLKELPENPTEQDIKAYREERGVPESWDKYDIELKDGYVIPDKTAVEEYLKLAHSKHRTPGEVKSNLQDFYELQAKEQSVLYEQKIKEAKEAQEQLGKEWGNQLNQNVNVINDYLKNEFGEELSKKLRGAILSDGTSLENNPKILNHFLEKARKEMNVGTLMPNSTNDVLSLESRKKELERYAAQNKIAFYNNPEMRKELAMITMSYNKAKNGR